MGGQKNRWGVEKIGGGVKKIGGPDKKRLVFVGYEAGGKVESRAI